MGGISESLKKAALKRGIEIRVNTDVKEIKLLKKLNKVTGVELSDGTIINSDIVISNCIFYKILIIIKIGTPDTTFKKLLNNSDKILPFEYRKKIDSIDYNAANFKINLAVNKLPNFKCYPN